MNQDTPSYLIHHYERQVVHDQKGRRIYCDDTIDNQDPYIWNHRFLNSFCHVPQIQKHKGQINFWVFAEKENDEIDHLFCDLVFVVDEIKVWNERNSIDKKDPIVDSRESFNDHYSWSMEGQHPLKRKRRVTLKADPTLSYQPQNRNGDLIDILPALAEIGIQKKDLPKLFKGYGSTKPIMLNSSQSIMLYDWIFKQSSIKLYGNELQAIRKRRSDLASKHHKRASSDCISCSRK